MFWTHQQAQQITSTQWSNTLPTVTPPPPKCLNIPVTLACTGAYNSENCEQSPIPTRKIHLEHLHLMMFMHTCIHRQVCQNSESTCSLSHRLSDTDQVVTHQLHWWLLHTLSSLQDIKQECYKEHTCHLLKQSDSKVWQTDLQPMEK